MWGPGSTGTTMNGSSAHARHCCTFMQQQDLRNLQGKELLGFFFWLKMEEALLRKTSGS